MNTPPPWKQAATLSMLPTDGEPELLQQTRVLFQVLAAGGCSLPNFLLKQMEESIVRAIAEHELHYRPLASTAEGAIQLTIYLSTAEAVASQARWGFFMVQKKGEQTGAPTLFLDLYLYQE